MRRRWTWAELLARPAVTVAEAAQLLGCGESTVYRAVDEGRFPVPPVRVGSRLAIPTRPLLALLGLVPDDASDPEAMDEFDARLDASIDALERAARNGQKASRADA